MDPNGIPIETLYGRRVAHFSAIEKRYASRQRMVMNLRVATFIVAVAMFVLGLNNRDARLWCFVGAGVALAGFSAAVAYHDHVRRQLQRNGLLREINQEAIARLHRDWTALPETLVEVPPQHRATADDLDLFGHASLFQFLNMATTPIGIRVVRDWLVEPASPDEIQRRQQAAVELSSHLDLRQTLILEGRLLADRGAAMERFAQWAEGGPWLAARPWLLWLCRTLAAAALLILVLTFGGVLSNEQGGITFFVMLFLNANVIALFGGKVHDICAPLNLRRGEATRVLRHV